MGVSLGIPKSNSTEQGCKHAKEHALTEREFEELWEATYSLSDYWGLQSRFVLVACGRLGLRAGELAHLEAHWIDQDDGRLTVPIHEPCRRGRDGGICSYCKNRANDKFERDDSDEHSLEDYLEAQWHPKTQAGARSIPYDWSPRAELVLEQFFEQYDRWPHGRQSVNRRVNRVAEHCPTIDVDDIFPHALRATAASIHAAKGLDVTPLKSFFGWVQTETADVYICGSPERTHRAVRSNW